MRISVNLFRATFWLWLLSNCISELAVETVAFSQERQKPWLTFNPRLSLTGFWTTEPWRFEVALKTSHFVQIEKKYIFTDVPRMMFRFRWKIKKKKKKRKKTKKKLRYGHFKNYKMYSIFIQYCDSVSDMRSSVIFSAVDIQSWVCLLRNNKQLAVMFAFIHIPSNYFDSV